MRIDEEARWQIRMDVQPAVQLPTQLVQSAIEGTVSPGAFLTYATLFSISDDDLARPLEEIAQARGISSRCLEKHLDQLDTTGWIDRDTPAIDQAERPTRRVLSLRFARRTDAA